MTHLKGTRVPTAHVGDGAIVILSKEATETEG